MTTATLKITDQSLSGKTINEINLQFRKSRVTLKEIISSRVESEVMNYNKKATEYFNGLVQPVEAEETLNGYRVKEGHKIDAEKQVYIALNAFQDNRYFVLVDDRQVETLDEQVQITPQTKVSFIKLTPLVGG